MKTSFVLIASVGLAMATASLLVAGPTTPPAGPVAPTHKTLSEIEPRVAITATNTPGDADCLYKITSPGSYYLTEQIGVPPGKSGIRVTCDNVTIDLNGYRLGGYPNAKGGIVVDQFHSNITIGNGFVGPFNGVGVYLNGSVSDRSRAHVHDLTVSDCVYGIHAATSCLIERVIASSCSVYGIEAGANSIVSECVAEGCVVGIIGGMDGVVQRCLANANKEHGIVAGERSVVRENICSSNGVDSELGAGILVMAPVGVRIEDNHCAGNNRGVYTIGGGALVVRNTCVDNGTDWLLAPSTIHGPIIDRSNAANPGVSGKSAPDATGSAHPQANFSY